MTVVQALLRLKGGGCWSIFGLVYNCGAQVQTANVARKWRISHFHCLPPQTTVLSRGLQPPAHTGYTHGAGERPPPSQMHHSTARPGQGEHCHAPSMWWMPNHDSPCICSQVSYREQEVEWGLPACWRTGGHSGKRVATVIEDKRSDEVWDTRGWAWGAGPPVSWALLSHQTSVTWQIQREIKKCKRVMAVR